MFKGSNKETVSANIRKMMDEGYDQKQAVAASLRNARKYAKGKRKSQLAKPKRKADKD